MQESWKSLKSICWPPARLIDKRRQICDHIKNIWKFDCQANTKQAVMIDNKEAALNKFQNYLELHLFQINKAKYKNELEIKIR